MTDELLKGLVAQAANMAKTELRLRHKLNGILACYFEGQALHRMRSIEKIAEEHFGERWLNSDEAKYVIFGVLRAGAAGISPDALVIATAINDFEAQPAFWELSEEERDRIVREQNVRAYPRYFVPHDALMAIAQTPERACILRQRLQGTLSIGDPDVHCFPQEQFTGRLKMFGVPPPPEIEEQLKNCWRTQ